MYKIACLSLLGVSLAVAPGLAQNRFMDEAREKAARRSENAAVRAAENPETPRTATTHQPDARIPAGSQPPVAPTDPQPAASAETQPAIPPAASAQ
jgi:hypothetical protein